MGKAKSVAENEEADADKQLRQNVGCSLILGTGFFVSAAVFVERFESITDDFQRRRKPFEKLIASFASLGEDGLQEDEFRLHLSESA